jgi:hypothetical protein
VHYRLPAGSALAAMRFAGANEERSHIGHCEADAVHIACAWDSRRGARVT